MKAAELRVSRAMQSLAETIDENLETVAGERMAFFLLVVPFNKTGEQRGANFVSNIPREKTIELLRSQLDYFQRVETDKALHALEGVKNS